MSGVAARDLTRLNLNQLVALEVLLRERNLRRAADAMGVTQSAMSHTLRALREMLSDPLLVRVGNEMVPTPHAGTIADNLRRGLAELETVVRGRAAFSPASIDDEFTLAVDGGLAAFLLPPLYRALREHAPKARLRVAAPRPADLCDQLLRGDADAALVPPMIDTHGLQRESILSAGLLVLVREDHPHIKKRLTLDAYCRTPHAVITVSGEGRGLVDELLAPLDRTRHVRVKVPHLFALPELLVSSDLIATVPGPAARALCEQWPLRALRPPIPYPPQPMHLCWHGRYGADPASSFFRDLVRQAARELESERAPIS